MSADRDTVLFHIVDYLKRTRDEDSAHSVEYSTAIAALESTIPSAADNFKKAAFCPHVNLETVFQSGQDALKLKSFASSLETAQANPKFDPFLELVTSKGYFEGSEPGSIEYLEKQSKVLLKFQQKSAVPTKEELELKAEEVKLAGNAAINAKDYAKAVELYSEALQLSPEGPNSHVYYSNRAAAYCSLQKYQESVDDCTQAIVLSPDFVRAHSRLGLSYFFLRQYEESVEAYERALEIEPDNKQTQDSLKSAKNKLRKSRAAADGSAVSSSSSSGAGDGAMPDLSSLAGMMGGAGGMPDMSGLLANPKMKDAFDKAGGAAGKFWLCTIPYLINNSSGKFNYIIRCLKS